MHPMTPLALVPFALALAPLGARAQGELYSWPTGMPMVEGGPVACLGDVDGDGFADIARTGFLSSAPPGLRVHSGATGNLLLTVFGASPNDGFGRALTGPGDVDGDGRPDVVVAATDYLRCVSGATGATLWHVASPPVIYPGPELAPIGDQDGDGVREIAVGIVAPLVGQFGVVQVRSGRTGALIHTVPLPPGASLDFGRSVASAGDFDSDGVDDLLVGDPGGSASLGQVTVHSIASSVLLRSFVGPVNPHTSITGFGWSVATPGDIDGDGVSDVLVGAPSECLAPPGPMGCVSGRVRLISGASGAVLWTIEQSTAFRGLGTKLARFPDLDGDGLDDLIVANGRHKNGTVLIPAEVFVFSSGSGATLYAGDRHAGNHLAVVPDLNGDGVAEYATSPAYPFSTTLVAVPFAPPITSSIPCAPKTSSAGCRSQLGFQGAPSLSVGPDLLIYAPNVHRSTVGMFVHGAQAATIPFAGGVLCVAPPIRRMAVSSTGGGAATCSGSLQQSFTKASLAALGYPPGTSFVMQAWYRDQGFPAPNNVGLSNALLISIWP